MSWVTWGLKNLFISRYWLYVYMYGGQCFRGAKGESLHFILEYVNSQ